MTNARVTGDGERSEAQAAPASGETDDDPLILWFLSLTPTERLEAHQDFVDGNWARCEGRPAGGLLTLKRLAEREKKKDSV